MIYKLRRRFILICTVSVLTAIFLVLCVTLVFNIFALNKNMDILTDKVAGGGGLFPRITDSQERPLKAPPQKEEPHFITPETPFSTRHFTVFFDNDGNVTKTNTKSIYSVGDDEAVEYAKSVLASEKERGWSDNYRYKVFATEAGRAVVFVDGSMSISSLTQSMTTTALVFLGCAALILLLIIILSRRVVKPIAESYEKQKQFVTDANHELKTPLTLILANLDIAEAELGQNEWLDDIRSEGNRMAELVDHLVSLSRMDEEKRTIDLADVAFGSLVADTVSEFAVLAEARGKRVVTNIETGISCKGDRTLLCRLVGILMDNAVKYCDAGGEISVSLTRGRRIELVVENTYEAVAELELHRLFDRFYRADKARKFNGGYGIGLSMAKAIAEKHKAELSVSSSSNTISFRLAI